MGFPFLIGTVTAREKNESVPKIKEAVVNSIRFDYADYTGRSGKSFSPDPKTS
jgi:hypothetical protein